MSNKTHLIADPTLGGLQREYVETDRKADVGDFVIITPADGPREVTYVGEDCLTVDGLYHTNLSKITAILDPTDIVHAEGERYKLVDRHAEVGEKVVAVIYKADETETREGDILTCTRNDEFDDESIDCGKAFFDVESGDKYFVLEPVESEITSEGGESYSSCDGPIEVNASQASPEVIEMLANLSQRIVSLESQVEDNLEALETHALKIVRLEDEIDTLHANQKRMAEELENTKAQADNDTVVAELSRLLARESRKVGR